MIIRNTLLAITIFLSFDYAYVHSIPFFGRNHQDYCYYHGGLSLKQRDDDTKNNNEEDGIISPRVRGGAVKKQQAIRSMITTINIGKINHEPETKKINPSSSRRRIIKTQLDGLAPEFQQTLHRTAKNNIHVGKLLLACRKMEITMRNAGMKQSANDLAKNIQKVQECYDKCPKDQRDSMVTLLRWEIEQGVHNIGPKHFKLKDNSGAMGCLWLARNLQYQYNMYRLILEKKHEPIEAARLSYQQTLRPHLPWPMQKVAESAITNLTPSKSSALFSQIGGFVYSDGQMELQEVVEATKRDLHRILDTWHPLLIEWQSIFKHLKLESI